MSKEGIVFAPAAHDIKPKGLLHALSEIEQFSVVERHPPIPEQALTTINLFSWV